MDMHPMHHLPLGRQKNWSKIKDGEKQIQIRHKLKNFNLRGGEKYGQEKIS